MLSWIQGFDETLVPLFRVIVVCVYKIVENELTAVSGSAVIWLFASLFFSLKKKKITFGINFNK